MCVIGGGVVGCSVAYHAAPDASVVLLEQKRLGGGTTWHAAGLVGQLRASNAETLMSGVYASRLYRELEEQTGLSCGYKAVGSVTIARTQERLELLRRTASRARSYGLEVHEVSVEEANERTSGVMSLHDVTGALWIPGDGAVDASNVCAALAKAARSRGAELREHQRVVAVARDGDHWRVQVEGQPDILCKQVVNCGGQWARQLAKMSNIEVPLHSCNHFYVVSRPSASLEIPSNLPIVRDQDGFLYAREWSGGLMVGTFELNAKAAFEDGVPDDFEFSLLPDDWDHFMPYMEDILERFPQLAEARWDMTNGPESFTFDNAPCAGEVPGNPGYFVAAGMCSAGIASAPGVGRMMADWLRKGTPSHAVGHSDMWRVPEFLTQSYCRKKAEESLGLHYMLRLPKQESEACRGLRRSPLFNSLKANGASFGTKAGWERPNFFSTEGDSAEIPAYGFQEAAWIAPQLREHLICRESAALFDTTSFAKTLVVGADAAQGLSWLCANEIRGRAGFATYTQMLNERGGVEADVTVREVSPGQWLVLSPTASGLRDRSWLERHLPSSCTILDVTAQYTVLALQGPKSLDVLAAAGGCQEELLSMRQNEAKTVELGFVKVTAVRTSYVGERLGWEIIVASDLAQYVYEELRGNGAQDAGYLAIDSLRMEKGRVAWGHELSPAETPLEAGLGFAVKRGKEGGFLGETALSQPKKRLCLLSRPLGEVGQLRGVAWGGEPVVVAGDYTGEQVTSACLRPRRQPDGSVHVDNLAMAYLENHQAETFLEVAGERLPMSVARLPLRG